MQKNELNNMTNLKTLASVKEALHKEYMLYNSVYI